MIPRRGGGADALPRGVLRPGDDPAGRVYLRPLHLEAGNPPVFSHVEVLIRPATAGGRPAAVAAPVDDVVAWAWWEGEDLGVHVSRTLDRLTRRRAPFAGLALERPLVMGIVNVTPDSFSDGGETAQAAQAIARGLAMRAAGADIVDVGGESTRPGAAPVAEADELARVLPVVRGLAEAGAVVSIDTRRAAVMAAALAAGARIVNDVSALADPLAGATVAGANAAVVLMHMKGDPQTMQRDPRYASAILDVYDALEARVGAAMAAGIAPGAIAIDPGIGFGKTIEHNLDLLARFALLGGLGTATMVGASRKSFIGRLSGDAPVGERLGGSLAAALTAAARGAHIVRVHDVPATVQALAVAGALARAEAAAP